MELINKFNKECNFYHVLLIYTSVIPLKYKKGITSTNAFQNILIESNRKIWID